MFNIMCRSLICVFSHDWAATIQQVNDDFFLSSLSCLLLFSFCRCHAWYHASFANRGSRSKLNWIYWCPILGKNLPTNCSFVGICVSSFCHIHCSIISKQYLNVFLSWRTIFWHWWARLKQANLAKVRVSERGGGEFKLYSEWRCKKNIFFSLRIHFHTNSHILCLRKNGQCIIKMCAVLE